MIDWLTLSISAISLPESVIEAFKTDTERVQRIDVRTGEVKWEFIPWDKIRSDTHAINVRYGTKILIAGSPARLFSEYNDNVFGPDNIRACAKSMLDFVAFSKEITLPDYRFWDCHRTDITLNYQLPKGTNDRDVINYLKLCSGGRRIAKSDKYGVCWSPTSDTQTGKAYLKYYHLLHQAKKHIHCVPAELIEKTKNLLRLELKLGKKYFDRKRADIRWHQLTEFDLINENINYFRDILGEMNVSDMNNLSEIIKEKAISNGFTEGMAAAAYSTYLAIKTDGLNTIEDNFRNEENGRLSSTYLRHKRILKLAGLSHADMQCDVLRPIKFQPIILGEPVTSWQQLINQG